MWLVDTSVWIEHFRRGRTDLAQRLLEGLVLMHPYVSGELSCGNLKRREELLSDLNALPLAKLATDSEVSRLIEDQRLWGRGLGWVDVHLLASVLITQTDFWQTGFWTFDKRLGRAARDLGVHTLIK